MQHVKASAHTVFSADDIVQIRAAKGKQDVRDIADWYGVAPSTIRKIWRGETFRNVGRAPGSPVQQPMREEPPEDVKQAAHEALLAALKVQKEMQADRMLEDLRDTSGLSDDKPIERDTSNFPDYLKG